MKQLAQLFKALGDETRLEIIRLLIGKELCVCDIIDAFHISQPAISHHLKVLKQAKLLTDTREGKWIYYSLNVETFQQVEGFLQDIEHNSVSKEHCKPCSLKQLPNK